MSPRTPYTLAENQTVSSYRPMTNTAALASLTSTATRNSADLSNTSYRGVRIYCDINNVDAVTVPAVNVVWQVLDADRSTYSSIFVGPTATAARTDTYCIYPGIASGTLTTSTIIGMTNRVQLVHNNDGHVVASIRVDWIP
mgnify:FL=1